MRFITLFLCVALLPAAYAEFAAEGQLHSFIEGPQIPRSDARVLQDFRFNFESGFYTGATRFQKNEVSEKDAHFWRNYAGYRNSLGTTDLGWHTGVSLYRARDTSFPGLTEIYGGLQYKSFTTRLSLSPGNKAGVGEAAGMHAQFEAGMNMELNNGLGLGFSVGRYADGGALGDATTYQLHLNKTYQGFGLGFDVGNKGYADEQQILPGILDDARFNFTVTREF